MKKGNILLFALAFGSFLNASGVLATILKRGEKKSCGHTLRVKSKAGEIKFDLTKKGLGQLAAKVKKDEAGQSKGRADSRGAQKTLRDILAAITGHKCSGKKKSRAI